MDIKHRLLYYKGLIEEPCHIIPGSTGIMDFGGFLLQDFLLDDGFMEPIKRLNYSKELLGEELRRSIYRGEESTESEIAISYSLTSSTSECFSIEE